MSQKPNDSMVASLQSWPSTAAWAVGLHLNSPRAKTLPSAIEQPDHLIVGGLGEVAIFLADGEKELGRV